MQPVDDAGGEPSERTKAPVTRVLLERVTRIELAFSAWEADVLPLNYTRAGAGAYPTAVAARPWNERYRPGAYESPSGPTPCTFWSAPPTKSA